MKRFDFYGLLESRRCYFCGARAEDPSGLCPECLSGLKASVLKDGGLCPRCSRPLGGRSTLCPFCSRIPDELNALVSCGYFHGCLKELVSAFKKDSPAYAFFFAEILYQRLRLRGWEGLPIVPVPPRKGKIRRQGWDQVRFLAGILKKNYGMKVFDCLRRIDRIQQKSLDYEQRLRHMKSSLILSKPGKIPDDAREIIVLDDIFTSGATIAAAAGLVREGRDVKIYGAVLCSVI